MGTQLKKYITLPLLLSSERDEELLKLTEHRYLLYGYPVEEVPVYHPAATPLT
jgi:hypothetical protein